MVCEMDHRTGVCENPLAGPAMTLADMIGASRSRDSVFMNSFRALRFSSYGSEWRVHCSLLTILLHSTRMSGPSLFLD